MSDRPDGYRGAITWGTWSRVLDGNMPGDEERAAIHAHLIRAGMSDGPESNHAATALAKTCPSLAWAQLLYPETK